MTDRQTVTRAAWLLPLTVALLATASAATIHVTPAGADPVGANWSTPTSLTNALAICTSTDQVWVAEGTYTNGATFTVGADCSVYGGFTNGMATFAERDWTTYPAILDGNAQNRRVVTVTGGNVILDGLVISNSYGSAAGGLAKTVAGDLTLANCRVVRHEGRTTDMKGIGAYFTGGPVLMTNCVVEANTISGSAWNGQGFGICAIGADLTVMDCLFTNQYGDYVATRSARGLALYFDQGNLQVLRTDFVDNIGGANNGGGGSAVYLGNGAPLSAVISNCVFRGNKGLFLNANNSSGAALWADLAAGGTATVVNCTFNDNDNQEGDGGAIRLGGGTLTLKNSILWANQASRTGRVGDEIAVNGGTLQASHCILTGRTLPQVYVSGGAAAFSNCGTNDPLFASATDLHVQSPAGRWENGSHVMGDTVYSPAIDASDPSDSVGFEPSENGARRNLGAYGGTAEASKSPVPVAPQVANRTPVTLQYTRMSLRGELTNGAPVIATVGIVYGTNSVAGETTNGWEYVDQLYPPRQTGVVFSITTPFLLTNTTYYYRAYATNAAGGSWAPIESFTTAADYPPLWGVGGGADVIHVRLDAVGEADGRDWVNAYTTLGDGIAAIGGTRTNLWIAGGTYPDEYVQLALATNATIVGGFAGTETAVAQRALTNALGVVTNYAFWDGAGVHRCLALTAGDVSIEALSFSNSPTGRALSKTGGGALTLRNCRFERNTGGPSDSGGGAYLSGGTVRLYDCWAVSNQCDGSGVGIHFANATVLMTNCVVAGNRHGFNNPDAAHSQLGIGVYASGGTLDIVDCEFRDQLGHLNGSRTARGGGLAFDSGTLRVGRTDFVGNRNVGHPYAGAVGGGAAVYLGKNANVTATFSNCVFRANEVMKTTAGGGTPGWGGAVQAVMTAASTAAFVNCSFAFNTNAYGPGGAIVVAGGTVALRNSIVWSNELADLAFSGYDLYATNAAAFAATYSCVTATNAPYVVAGGGATVVWGAGIRIADPLFAGETDLHLQSRGGRWDPGAGTWVKDRETSPGVDTGDRADPYRDEPEPNGRRINLGAYGGTWQASKTPLLGTIILFQ